MKSPPLTRSEVAAVLRRQIARLVGCGVDRAVATRMVADEHGVDPVRVAELVASADVVAGGAS